MTARTETGTRSCRLCGGRFERRRGESVPAFERRQLCSRTCALTAGRAARSVAAVETRFCASPLCGRQLVRRDGELPAEFVDRRFCDRGCQRGQYAGQHRPCEAPGCGATIVRPAQLSAARWARRRYCGARCKAVAQRADPSVSSADRKRVRDLERARARREQENVVRCAAGEAQVSVFGDVAPAVAWRPASWRDPELAVGTARTVA